MIGWSTYIIHPLRSDLDLGTDEVAVEELPVLDQVELADLLAWLRVVHLTALFAALLLEGPRVFLISAYFIHNMLFFGWAGLYEHTHTKWLNNGQAKFISYQHLSKSRYLHFSEVGNRSCKLECICLFLCAEAEGVESNIRELQFLGIVDGIHLDLSLREAATNK